LDALVAKGICTVVEIDEGKQLLLRITSMLTKLIDRFDVSSSSSPSFIREEPNRQGFEDEDENENEDQNEE
jgi:hypothetical protein